jgi:hypothetical protein
MVWWKYRRPSIPQCSVWMMWCVLGAEAAEHDTTIGEDAVGVGLGEVQEFGAGADEDAAEVVRSDAGGDQETVGDDAGDVGDAIAVGVFEEDDLVVAGGRGRTSRSCRPSARRGPRGRPAGRCWRSRPERRPAVSQFMWTGFSSSGFSAKRVMRRPSESSKSGRGRDAATVSLAGVLGSGGSELGWPAETAMASASAFSISGSNFGISTAFLPCSRLRKPKM